MEKRLYVGNLPFDTSEDELHQLFSAHGQIVSAKLITDMETGRSRGFGFVEMSTEDEAKAAIAEVLAVDPEHPEAKELAEEWKDAGK